MFNIISRLICGVVLVKFVVRRQANQEAKEGAVGGLHMNETKTPIPWQTAKSKIEEYTTSKWKHKWKITPQ